MRFCCVRIRRRSSIDIRWVVNELMTMTDLVGLKDDTFQVHLRPNTARIVLVLAGRFHYRIDVITIGTLAACSEMMQPIFAWYCMLVNDLEL